MRSPAAAAAVTAALVAAVALWSARPAEPRPADVPAAEFSEARAWPVVAHLARTKRIAGSTEAGDALRYLEAEMRAVPGLEVDVQAITAFANGPYSGPTIYTVRNLVARLPGTDPGSGAVLVAAHYDSAVMSHGAADDGVGCAAVVEAARCLAAGPRPRRSVVFLLDEGEELGLFGAQGFLHHPWAQDLVTFLNLEAAGCRGRPILFQTGPGDPWLAAAYAAAAPHPHGTVLGQDVFQSGAIPSDTDFRVYRDDAGLRGLDLALYRDGWGYHTTRDRIERLEPGSLQEMGDNAVAVLRELAWMDLPSMHTATPAVYYDIAGLWMVSYGAPVAWLLALIAVLSLAHALRAAGRERGVGVAGLASGAAWAAAALAAAFAVTLALASLLDVWRDGVSGWYARPWLAVVAYGVPAGIAVLLVARLAVLRSVTTPVTAATRLAGGAAIVFATLLAVTTWLGLGSAYLLLWWVVGATAAVRLAARGRLATAVVIGCVFPGLLTAQAADALIVTFVPIAGRMQGPMEHVIALLAALPLAVSLLLPAAVVAAAPPRWGRGVLRAAAVVAAAALIGVAAWFPYTPERPQRRAYAVLQDARDADVATRTPTMARSPFGDGMLQIDFREARLGYAVEVPAPDGVVRRVRALVHPNGATAVVLTFPRGAVARIVVDDGPTWTPPDIGRLAAASFDRLTFLACGPVPVTIDLTSNEQVEFHLRAWHLDMPPEIEARVRALQDWVAPEPAAWVQSVERL